MGETKSHNCRNALLCKPPRPAFKLATRLYIISFCLLLSWIVGRNLCLGWPAPTRSRAEGSYQLRVDPKRSESGPTRNVARESGAHCACVLEYGSAAPLLVLAQIWESSLNSDKKSANLFFL